MTLQGLGGGDSIIVPDGAESLLVSIKSVANNRQNRVLVPAVEKSVTSIEHKLNIACYNAGLILDMKEEDFLRFRYHIMVADVRDVQSVDVSYKNRCLFTLTELKEYLLFLTFFLETFAAASFSLFDVCGHLLNELYGLQLNVSDASFFKVVNEHRIKASGLDSFLSSYTPGEANIKDWITPLKKVRNVSTHRSITDICRFPPDDGNLYNPPKRPDFLMHDTLFPKFADDKHLKEFVEECFDGLEEFTVNLFRELRLETERHNSLPLP